MKRRAVLLLFAMIGALSVCFASPSMAQYPIKTTFVHLASGVPGVLYEPVTPVAKSQTGVFVMHSGSDYLSFSAGPELSRRGYRVLCANNSTSKSGFTADSNTDKMISEARLGVAYLRKHPGIKKVVLLGHSGGGGLMSSYQNIAENGLKACQGPEKIAKCSNALADLPPADGLILLDSTIGLAGMNLLSLDPAVIDEENGRMLDPELDMYNPQNGFNPKGSTYSGPFIRRFFEKQKERNNRLIEKAMDRLKLIEAGKGRFTDDEPFVVPGGNFKAMNNRLFTQDIRLWSHTRKEWPLLRGDGSVVKQVIRSVRVPENVASPTPALEGGGLTTTVRRFLSTFAIRATEGYGYGEDYLAGIDWASNYNNTPNSVAGISVPLLQLGMTGHWEYFLAETIFERAKSADKTLAFVEGAIHNFTTCTKCEKTPGQFGNTLKTTYDYVDNWLNAPGRFHE
jgi:hypothetical protein